MSIREKFIKALLGFNADDIADMVKKVEGLHWESDDLRKREVKHIADLTQKLQRLTDLGESSFNILKVQRDNISQSRKQLWETRETDQYKKVFDNKAPLVTVRIATYNNADKLMDVALKSVLNQTYKNIEVIIVGDHCTDDTAERIKKLEDERVAFINLPYRSIYPEDPYNKWLVAGSPGMNVGAYLARGEWIAPLDDDDEFLPDHIEKLLDLALKEKVEIVYGAINQKNNVTGETRTLYSDMPKFGEFSFQSAMYMRMLSFFEYDQQSWVVGEPGDWNLCRRMLLSGVRIASTVDKVTTINMTPPHLKLNK